MWTRMFRDVFFRAPRPRRENARAVERERAVAPSRAFMPLLIAVARSRRTFGRARVGARARNVGTRPARRARERALRAARARR